MGLPWSPFTDWPGWKDSFLYCIEAFLTYAKRNQSAIERIAIAWSEYSGCFVVSMARRCLPALGGGNHAKGGMASRGYSIHSYEPFALFKTTA
jgi:hypothetical protein